MIKVYLNICVLILMLEFCVQECGPQFTLKLVTLQHGTFDTKGGEFEWVHKVKKIHRKIMLLLSALVPSN